MDFSKLIFLFVQKQKTQQQGQIYSFNYDPAQLVSHAPNQQIQSSSNNQPQAYASSSGHQSNQQNLPQSNDDNAVINNLQINQERDEAGYLNGLDYTICFRKENGFCSQTYYVNSTHSPFEILNLDNCKSIN